MLVERVHDDIRIAYFGMRTILWGIIHEGTKRSVLRAGAKTID